MQDVVITGVGVISPIGIGKTAYWQSVCSATSGVRPLAFLANTGLESNFGGWIDHFDPKQYVTPRKSLKVMSREIQFSFAAANMAWEDAGLTGRELDPERLGVVCGSDMIYGDPFEQVAVYQACMEDGQFSYSRWGKHACSEIYPLWMLKYLPNMPACHISISHDARGPCNAIVSSEASSLLAIAEGYRVIRRGMADCMLVGGTGSRLHPTPLIWRGGANTSRRHDAPEDACRPFDADRDGLVNSEGAGMLILESRLHAERRKAEILGRILGVGISFGQPAGKKMGTSSDAIERSITWAMTAAGMDGRDLSHVNAHGLSTEEDDIAEAVAIQKTVGDVPVTAPKSLFGNLGAGSGCVELIASILGLVEQVIPPSRNYVTPDPRCPVQVVTGKPPRTPKPAVLALNQNRLGTATAIVVARE
ncbi:MAG: beta-ketoacyl-[acyl-carrier-protein] synthase family protein [Pirellulales bacterium]|nr:beta-ketoacyl-[acyl-carrier-protein] synthase family protein [Pirellulales bacterium]